MVRMLCASCNTRHSEHNMGYEWMQAHLTPSQKPSPHSLKVLKSLFIPSVPLRDEKTRKTLDQQPETKNLTTIPHSDI